MVEQTASSPQTHTLHGLLSALRPRGRLGPGGGGRWPLARRPQEATRVIGELRERIPQPSDFQPVWHKNSENMHYLAVWSGALTFPPLDCQKGKKDNTTVAVRCECPVLTQTCVGHIIALHLLVTSNNKVVCDC